MNATMQTVDDCWNRIGVNGDQSCAELARVIHCRNCPVFADAARRNLQRPVDRGYLAEWADYFSQPSADTERADQAALVFRIGREWLAVPADAVDTVAPLAQGHRLPHRSSAVLLGIVSVGGKMTPWIALDALLGIDGAADAGERTTAGRHVFARLLVLRADGQRFAMQVVELHGVVRYRASELGAPPATVNKGLERLISGVLALAGRRVGVLDAGLLCHQMVRSLR